jgi:hypothetical protein
MNGSRVCHITAIHYYSSVTATPICGKYAEFQDFFATATLSRR